MYRGSIAISSLWLLPLRFYFHTISSSIFPFYRSLQNSGWSGAQCHTCNLMYKLRQRMIIAWSSWAKNSDALIGFSKCPLFLTLLTSALCHVLHFLIYKLLISLLPSYGTFQALVFGVSFLVTVDAPLLRILQPQIRLTARWKCMGRDLPPSDCADRFYIIPLNEDNSYAWALGLH